MHRHGDRTGRVDRQATLLPGIVEPLVPPPIKVKRRRPRLPSVACAERLLDTREWEGGAHVLRHAPYILVHTLAGGEVVRNAQLVSHVMHDVMHPAAVQARRKG